MKWYFLCTCSLWVFLLSVIKSQNSILTDIIVNIDYEGSNLDNGATFYKFIVNDNPNSQDLVISVSPSDKFKEFSDPDIFISKSIPFPTRIANDWKSSNLGQDFISIEAKEISQGAVFYISVYCEKKCGFKLNLQLTTELIIYANEEKRIFLSKNDKSVFKYKVENITEMGNVGIFAYSESPKEFKIFVAMGKYQLK
jgi:hypothetical protein